MYWFLKHCLGEQGLMAGVGMLTAVSAPTRLAVEMAEQHNLALAGLVRGNTFTAYSRPSRFMTSQPIALQA